MDAIAITALLVFRPGAARVLAARWRAFTLTLLIAGVAGSLPLSAARLSFPTRAALIVMPCRLHAGTLRAGEVKTLSFELRNDTDGPVRIDSLKSSCDCLHVELAAHVIEPNSSVSGIVIVDTSREASFRGDLEMDLTGRNAEHGVLFRVAVEATVR